ncbi:MAG: LCP family protein [Armatimonadetes bacterium]|nr:LCP family protein [Armatimonadota bacterium]
MVVFVCVFLLGGLAGAYLAFFKAAGMLTGNTVTERPQQGTPVAWPLRLTRRITILYIGTDVTYDAKHRVVPVSRADTLILASIDPVRRRATFVSIPRDTRAVIPGVGTTKVNAAHAFGGVDLTVRAVEQLLGVPVDFYVKMKIEGFIKLIDLLGGVDVDVERDMRYVDRWGGININLKKGYQRLNGKQAMDYARFRHEALGDIGRVGRQQKVMRAILERLRTREALFRSAPLIRAMTENTETNLTPQEIGALGWFLVRLPQDHFATHTLPGKFSPGYWEPEWPQIRELIAKEFYAVDPDVLAEATVEILGPAALARPARETAQRLERLGFKIARVGTIPEPVDATTVVDRGGKPEAARLLSAMLGRARVVTEMPQTSPQAARRGARPNPTADLVVLLGRDGANGNANSR